MSEIQQFNKFHNGFSLIELMVAVTLGLVITAGVIQVFLSTKQTYRITEGYAELQENARFSLDLLKRDIRQAGYAGCKSAERLNIQIIANDVTMATMDEETIITGNEAQASNNWSPSLTGLTNAKVQDGTDVVTIMRAQTCGGTVRPDTSSSAEIKINAPNICNIGQGSTVLISDCKDGHVFTVSNNSSTNSGKQTLTHANNENKENKLCTNYTVKSEATESKPAEWDCVTGTEKLYNSNAEVYKFSTVSYYIGQDDLVLRRYDHESKDDDALIDGIENMQIEYGLDDDGDNIIDRTANAKDVADKAEWGKVISAQISLLAQTLTDNLTVEDQVYSYNGVDDLSNDDGKLRRVFTTTIAIRNRIQ